VLYCQLIGAFVIRANIITIHPIATNTYPIAMRQVPPNDISLEFYGGLGNRFHNSLVNRWCIYLVRNEVGLFYITSILKLIFLLGF
jgi:hypothetical protein